MKGGIIFLPMAIQQTEIVNGGAQFVAESKSGEAALCERQCMEEEEEWRAEEAVVGKLPSG